MLIYFTLYPIARFRNDLGVETAVKQPRFSLIPLCAMD